MIWRIAALRFAAVAIVLAALAISSLNVARGDFAMGDFKGFYCSARVVMEHQNPYATDPLSRCEAIGAPSPLFVTRPGEVLPAPLPGYVIAAFVPLAALPFPAACALWLVLLAAAICAAAALFARIGAGDPWSIAVALSFTLVAVCLPVGELPPIALLGIALAAWGAREERQWVLAAGVALTFAEPQIGIALFVAALVLGRRFALPAIGAAVALGIVSLLAIGIAGNIEYVRVVLPAHLISELPSVLQYSLSWILYRLGAAPNEALLLGRLSWIVMLAVTAWFARTRFSRAHPEIALLSAPAFAVVGGPFLHLDHVALAIPAAMWLAMQRPSALRIASLVALATPVLYIFSIIRLFAIAPFVSGWIGGATARKPIVGLRSALLTVLALACIGAIAIRVGAASMVIPPLQPLPASLPQAEWATYIDKHFIMSGWAVWLVKAPIWFGIVATAATFVSLGLRTRRMTA